MEWSEGPDSCIKATKWLEEPEQQQGACLQVVCCYTVNRNLIACELFNSKQYAEKVPCYWLPNTCDGWKHVILNTVVEPK